MSYTIQTATPDDIQLNAPVNETVVNPHLNNLDARDQELKVFAEQLSSRLNTLKNSYNTLDGNLKVELEAEIARSEIMLQKVQAMKSTTSTQHTVTSHIHRIQNESAWNAPNGNVTNDYGSWTNPDGYSYGGTTWFHSLAHHNLHYAYNDPAYDYGAVIHPPTSNYKVAAYQAYVTEMNNMAPGNYHGLEANLGFWHVLRVVTNPALTECYVKGAISHCRSLVIRTTVVWEKQNNAIA